MNEGIRRKLDTEILLKLLESIESFGMSTFLELTQIEYHTNFYITNWWEEGM
jgi:hypothetical protein